MAKDGPHHMDMNISRQQFNELTADLVDKTVIPVEMLSMMQDLIRMI